jgi:stage II sporulation protein D
LRLQRTRLRDALACAALSLFCACAGTATRALPPALESSPTTHVTLPAEVCLRLAAHERATRLTIRGVSRADLSFEREGANIRCSNGALRRQFVLRPLHTTLAINECSYKGILRLVPHAAGGLRAELLLDLETYITGVVCAELPLLRALPAELQAQAIAARSYAHVRGMERHRAGHAPYLWDDTRDQVYVPPTTPPSAAERAAFARLSLAVAETRGLVLMHADAPFDARYHAACGGSTTTLSSIPAARAVACPGCLEETAGDLGWRFTATPAELSAVAIRLSLGDRLAVLEPMNPRPDGRWHEVHLIGNAGSAVIPAATLRALLRPDRFTSNLVLRTWPHPGQPITGGLLIEGRGRGHGVGMCQEGAHELALRGWDSARILRHYYPHTTTQTWTARPLP